MKKNFNGVLNLYFYLLKHVEFFSFRLSIVFQNSMQIGTKIFSFYKLILLMK